jgi:hypothetical protein
MQKAIIVVFLIIVVFFGGFASYTPQPVKARDDTCTQDPAPDEGEPIVDCGFVGDVQVIDTGPSRPPDIYHSIPIGPVSGGGPSGGTGGSGSVPPVHTPGYRFVCTGQDTPALTCYEMPVRLKGCPSFLRVVLHGAGPAGTVVAGITTVSAATGPPGWILGGIAIIGGFASGYINLDKMLEEKRQCQEPQVPF